MRAHTDDAVVYVLPHCKYRYSMSSELSDGLTGGINTDGWLHPSRI